MLWFLYSTLTTISLLHIAAGAGDLGDSFNVGPSKVRCAFFNMDSVVLGLAALGCACCTVRVLRPKSTLKNCR